MSFAYLIQVRKIADVTATERLLLYVLADCADDTGKSYYAQASLAELSSLSERSVRTHLASLEKKGLLTRAKRSTRERRLSDLITIQLPEKSSGSASGKSSSLPPAAVAANPVIEPVRKENQGSRARTRTRKEIGTLFDRLWSVFPKRDGYNPKSEARKTFERLADRSADLELIIETASNLHFWVDDDRYIPKLSTWLANEGWLDDYSCTNVIKFPQQAA